MVFITLISAVINEWLFDYIKYSIIDDATTPQTKEKNRLIKFFTTVIGAVVWFVVSFVARDEREFGVLDLFMSLTVGTISNHLHDANDILRQLVIAVKRAP